MAEYMSVSSSTLQYELSHHKVASQNFTYQVLGESRLANVASVLKEEITRLARKEIKSEIEGIRKASTQYRSEIAALKRRAATLEQQLSLLEKSSQKNAQVKASPEVATKVRFTSNGFKSLRERLGLSAMEVGTLLEVTAQTIYSWEKNWKSKPRESQLSKIAMLRGMGKREVASILENLAT
jgi:DNA-binding XRE family transcriptional regulator